MTQVWQPTSVVRLSPTIVPSQYRRRVLFMFPIPLCSLKGSDICRPISSPDEAHPRSPLACRFSDSPVDYRHEDGREFTGFNERFGHNSRDWIGRLDLDSRYAKEVASVYCPEP